jgi:hypothetical protein
VAKGWTEQSATTSPSTTTDTTPCPPSDGSTVGKCAGIPAGQPCC